MYNNSFSVLDGVVLKISDKFKPPPRVSLPLNWAPADCSELLSFQYDFEKEKKSINLAEEERLIKERNEQQKLQQEQQEKERLEVATADENNEDSQDENDESDENVNNDYENMSQILTPLAVTVTNQDIDSSKTIKPIQPINFHEFESQNQNPFELVELQTLNEFDELRSVLDSNGPSTKKKIQKQKKQTTVDDSDDFQLDISLVNPVNTMKMETQPEPENLIFTTASNIQTHSNVTMNNTNIPYFTTPSNVKNGTLTWASFEDNYFNPFASPNNVIPTHQGATQNQIPIKMSRNPFLNQQYQNDVSRQLSKSPPGVSSDSMFVENPVNNVSENIENNYGTLTKTKSLPNLNEDNEDYEFAGDFFVNKETDQIPNDSNDYMNVNKLELNQQVNVEGSVYLQNNYAAYSSKPPDYVNASSNPPDYVNASNFAPTDRINNIMQQYRFQRISPMSTAQNIDQCCPPIPSSSSGTNLSYSQPSQPAAAVEPINFNKLPDYPSIFSSKPPVVHNGYQTVSSSNNTLNYPNSTQVNSNFMFNSSHSIPSNQDNHNGYSVNKEIQSGPMLIQSKPAFNTNQSNQTLNLSPSARPVFHHPVKPILKDRIQPISSISSMPSQDTYLPHSVGVASLPNVNTSSQYATNNQLSQTLPSSSASWLVDETKTLSTSERNFATQLSGMGFPLPCVSRTIKRLGRDEKEVLDFLCLIQSVKDEHKYDINDIEVALVNNANDKDKTMTYLQMVSTFQELGFQPQLIHQALKETSCDQNKALDYLTR